MIHIGFDAKRLFLNETGLGNYSRDLVRGLLEHYPNNSYFLYTPKGELGLRTKFLINQPQVSIQYPKGFDKNLKSYWRSVKLEKDLKRDKIQVFHGLSHEIPKKRKDSNIKYVVTIHDLIFLRYPENYKAIDRKIYEKKVRYACENADVIIAISKQTKKDIVEFLGVSEEKIKVIYQTCANSFQQNIHYGYVETVRKKYNLPENFILSVGTIEKRKNVASLVKAIGKSNTKLPLVVVGSHTSYLNEVEKMVAKYKLENQVAFLQNVSFLDLPAIYKMANLFVYPSVFEGFGIPILEALYCKTPVIAATGSCLEEAGGPSSKYCNPHDTDKMAELIDLIIESPTLHEKMREDGYLYAQKFSSKTQADEVMEVYKSLV